jgi:purine-binding chemotaxis protein CheW
MDGTRTDHYILFTVAGTSYALPSDVVAHVEMVDQVTRVPNAAPFVDGVVFSRGHVVPAINMRARFGFDRVPQDVRTRLLVVQQGTRLVGLLVDACREFLTIGASAIRPPADAVAGMGGRYIAGMATIGDRLVVVLNLEPLLDAADLEPAV